MNNTNPEHKEGKIAKAIENQTAKLPSDIFLWAALGSMAASLTLKFIGKDKKHDALFVGQWAAPLLLLGVYNKLVKLQGSDSSEKGHAGSHSDSPESTHSDPHSHGTTNADKSIPGISHLATSPIVEVENQGY